MKLLIATGNKGKAREFADMLADFGVECVDLSSIVGVVEPEETGATFRANACLKASYYAKAANCFALADDSGLEVDAIDRNPGVKSARWAMLHDAGNGDQANNDLLLKQIDAVPDAQRSGRFVCVLALSDPQGRVLLTVRDTIEGMILRTPRGDNGFGYDPLFLVPSLCKTTAELSPAEKHAISHRGKALKRLRELIEQTGVLRPVAASR
jgi:XTP/dITP diphosphohydrolase